MLTTIRRPTYWTPQDDARLAAWTKQRKSDQWIADQLGRTVHSVEARRKLKGWMRWSHPVKPEHLGQKVNDPPPDVIEAIVNTLRAARGCEPVAWPTTN